MVSYASKHASQSLSNKPFVHTQLYLTHTLKTSRSYVDVQQIERLLYYWRYSLCCLELDEESTWRAMAPVSRSLIQHCARILQARTYIAIWCVTTPDNNIHVHSDCIPHIQRWLYCQRCIVL